MNKEDVWNSVMCKGYDLSLSLIRLYKYNNLSGEMVRF